MIALSIVLFAALVIAWMIAPSGTPVPSPAREPEAAPLQPEPQAA